MLCIAIFQEKKIIQAIVIIFCQQNKIACYFKIIVT